MSYAPTPYQHNVLSVPEKFNLLLAGGRGGGKSVAAQMLILRHVEQYGAAARPLVVRETYKALAEFEDSLEALLIDAYGTVQHNRAEHIFRLNNGAVIELGQLDSSNAFKKFQGRSYSLLVCEEVGSVKEMRWLKMLKSNLRSAEDIPLRCVYTANPGGVQHAHLHQQYISRAPAFHPFEIEGETWVCCPSTLRDNPYLDHADYETKLRAACGHDQELARAWIEGDWNIARGAMFSDVIDQKKQMLPQAWPHPVKKPWRSFLSLDWGTAAPSVAYVCAIAPGDVSAHGILFPKRSLILLDELASCDFNSGDFNQGLRWPASVLAERISELCRTWNIPSNGVGDDAAGIEDSLITFMRQYRIYLDKPIKGRITGWSRMREMLHASKERTGQPGLWVSQRCKYWWATVPNLPRDEYRLDDVDTAAPDHGADSCRYAVMHASIPPARNGTIVGAF